MHSTTPSAEARAEELRAFLSEYYGRRLRRTEDLERSACCADDTTSRYADVLALIPDEVKQRNYGCGATLPADDISGLTVLDLGCGAGLDAFIAARLVGERGRVIGIDMTEEQLAVARRNADEVMAAFGYARPNVAFHRDYIETAEAVDDGSVDLVISDCTVNLSPCKDRVFETIRRVLRPGGEFYISDIVADRRVPPEIASDPTLVAECLGGALYEHDLLDVVRAAGFGDPRVVTRRPVERDVAGVPIRFDSITLRGFALERPFDLRCEDYGQVARYLGTCPSCPARFVLDDHHVFERDRPVPVCRNTARMLSETRLARWFEVSAEGPHLGLFDCAPSVASDAGDSAQGTCC